MIGFLRGLICEVAADLAMVDVGGVGYELACSQSTLADLQNQIGKEAYVLTYTHVREDALQLFGFSTREEKNLFLSLLKVNGIGPKMALAILSGARVAQIHQWIEAGDAKALSSLPKLGKKTAEQLILTLKGKLVSIEEVVKSRNPSQAAISSALVNLGFKPQQVELFVAALPKDIEIEEGVRQGLQALSSAGI